MKLRILRGSLLVHLDPYWCSYVGTFPCVQTERVGRVGHFGPVCWTWIPDAEAPK